jgi:hypothetical protein
VMPVICWSATDYTLLGAIKNSRLWRTDLSVDPEGGYRSGIE